MPKHRKHRPPSQVRYDKTHPIISFRLDLETKQRLKKVLEKQSFASFIKEALGVREREKESEKKLLKSRYRMGYKTGHTVAKNRYGIHTRCDICGGDIIVWGEKNKKMIGEYLRDRRMCHDRCKKNRERKRMEGYY